MLGTKKILIVGGSGFVGTKLTEALLGLEYWVTVVDLIPSRVTHKNLIFIKADFSVDTVPSEILDGVYAVVNLAGANIGKRWTSKYQKVIYDSRVVTTRKLAQAISKTALKPSVLVSASAVGYYGDRGYRSLQEDFPAGGDFLAQLCVDWESETKRVEAQGVRVVVVRTAHVLGAGGLLSTLEPIFKKGLGGYFGNGFQYMPWVHWKDVVGIYIFAIENNIQNNVQGAYNVGAGKTITQKEFFRAFATAIKAPLAPFIFRIPYIVARIFLGRFAEALVSSENTSSEKIIEAGYKYEFEDVHMALADIYGDRASI